MSNHLCVNIFKCRWLQNWKCPIEGEKKDRKIADKLKLELVSQNLPFTFSVRGPDGIRLSELRLAPCVAVTSLVDAVISRLNALERYY